MNLEQALTAIQYDTSWGIWAELIDGELTGESEARYGQRIFDNGGLMDDKVFVCHGQVAGDHLAEWRDEDGDLVYGWLEEFLGPLNDARPWAE
jgi:hypothetical protein